MKIIDVFYAKGKTMIYCNDPKIPYDLKCSYIKVDGEKYKIEKCEVRNSLSDTPNTFFILDGDVKIQKNRELSIGDN